MPNWNSCTMPVTTPTAKLSSMIFPKKRVSRIHCGLRVLYQAVWKPATMPAMPMLIGTNRKW